MSVKRALIVLALPALLGLGCYAGPSRVSYAVAYGDPPPPPAYYYTPAPRDGYVWIDGNWYWNDAAWAWQPGYWVVARPGYYYSQGYWAGRSWHPGTWRAGGGRGTIVRDHRDFASGGGNVYVPSRQSYPVQQRGPAAGTVRVPSGGAPAVRSAPAPAPAPRSAPSGNVRDHRH